MAQTLSLEDVVASATDAALGNVWTSMPGRVESYDASLQRVNVRITVKSPTVGEDGAPNVQSIAVLTAVPVVFPGGSSFRFVAPLQAGDTVLLVFCSRSIDKWLLQGGIVDPGFTQKHHVSDAVAIPILRDFAHPLKNSPTDHASIGHDEGATIEFRPGEIRVGGDTGTQKTIMGETYRSAETSFFSVLNALVLALGAAVAALSAAAPALSGSPAQILAFEAAVTTVGLLVTAFNSAITTFNSGAASYLTTIAKVV